MYGSRMPNAPKTPISRFRIDPDEWRDFEHAVATQGLDRSTVIREFIAWYLRRPGIKTIKRPEIAEWIDAATAARDAATTEES